MKELNNFRNFLQEGKFEVGDLVYRRFDDKKAPMKVVGVRKMFASPLHAITVVGTSGGDELEYDETQLVKLMSPEEKANAFVRENEDLDEGVMDKLKKFGKKVKDVADKMDGGPDGGGIFGGLPGGKPTPQNQKEEMKKAQEGELHEGTWALGSVAEMVKVMGKLEQIRKMGAAKGGVELENLDNILYNVFGDDSFHDAIDSAKGTDDDDRFNNFMGDAQARAKELYIDELRDAKEQGETGFEFKPRFGLEENDAVLDEIIGEEKEEVNEAPAVFAEIDEMIGAIKDQMNPDDAFDSLVSEFEAISGGTKLLHRALKNISLDNNLMEEKEVEEIRSAYNEVKDEE